MSLPRDIHQLVVLLARLLDYLTHRYAVQVTFTSPENVMSNTVTLNAATTGSQSCPVSASATDNGAPIGVQFNFSSSDETVATVTNDTVTSGTVTGVADPSGSSTKTATITASGMVNQKPVSGTGVVTVVTSGDTVVVTVYFGTPTP